MMLRMKKGFLGRIGMCILLSAVLTGMVACRAQVQNPAEGYNANAPETEIDVYYVSNDRMTLLASAYTPTCPVSDTTAMVEEVLEVLQTNPANLATSAPISGNIVLRQYQL